jgi:hypothetical protein
MPYMNHREGEDGTADDQTSSYVVSSFYSDPTPKVIHAAFPTGSFATTQWQENRQAITIPAAKDVFAGAPASA